MGESPSRVRYGVLAALCIAALVAYVQRNSIAVAEEEIRRSLNLSKWQMGWVISAFFLTYAFLQLPAGFLGKIWGTRKALSIFAAVFSAAAGLFALATGMSSLLAARLAMGGTQAGIFPSAVNTISKWMPGARRTFASGMLASFMSIGGAVGMFATGWLLDADLDWRWIFALYCLPGMLFAVLFYCWFRDRPEQHTSVNEAERELIRGKEEDVGIEEIPDGRETHSEPTPWGEILTNPAILGLCGQQVFRAAGYMFFASWFATYLRETREIDNTAVGFLSGLPLLAVVFGSPIGGAVSDWVLARTGSRRLSRQGVAATAMLACCLLVLVAYPIGNPLVAVLLISAGSFCAAFGGPCAYTATIDMGGRHVPMVFSTMNMAGNIGAFIFPIVVPWLLSENELYVGRLVLSARPPRAETSSYVDSVVIRESSKLETETNAKKVANFGENDEVVLRFHHNTRKKKVIYLEAKCQVPSKIFPKPGPYEFSVDYAGPDPPPLRLIVNGKTISEDIIDRSAKVRAGFWPDEEAWHKSQLMTINLQKGNNLIRLETKTYASGNWDLVLFLFAGIFLAACVCWLFANTNVTIGGK